MKYRAIIQNSIEYIEANLRTEITAQELADRAGFSVFHYYRLFQAETGIPVMQYILHRRLLHAINDINAGSKAIDAALSYGFDTYAGFYRAFRREFGCTPALYMKENRVRQPYLPELDKEEHMIITHRKAAEILKNWGLENETITDIYYDGSGNRNENAFYVGDRYVLKMTADRSKLTNHMELSDALENVSMKTASPVKTTDGKSFVIDEGICFYLTVRVSGRQMTAAGFYEEDGESKARFVGEIIGQLHLVLRDADAQVSDADIYAGVSGWALPEIRKIMPELNGFFDEWLPVFTTLHGSLPRHIIHRDPNPGNIITSENDWGFIDFELSERNVRIYDPCYAATAILSESFADACPDRLRKWLDIYRNIIFGYDSAAKLTEEEWQAVPYILMANQIICTAWFCGQEKYPELAETNKRMTAWLVSVFDELKFNQ